MISYIKEKMAMAAEFISILTEKQAEEPKPPYKKQFMDATHTLFELARHLRQINEKLSLLDKDKDITLEELKSLSCCFNDLNDAKLEPFDILLEEAMAESGLKQYTGVLRLLGIEMFAFIHEYTRHKEWYDMQCSFEHQFSLYAKKAYTDGIGKVEKILAELPAAKMEIAITKQLKSVYEHFEKYPDKDNESKARSVTLNLLDSTGYNLGPIVNDLVLERHQDACDRLRQLEDELRYSINKCLPHMDRSHFEFKGVTFGLFAKLYDKVKAYSMLVGEHKCNYSDEMLPASKLYFTSILEALYHKCDGVIFEPASMRDYLETLNLTVASHGLKIKENKIGHACALVYALYNASSEDKRYLAGWEPQIITQLGIDPATYKQRKSDIKNGQASGSVMAFYDSIVGMLG